MSKVSNNPWLPKPYMPPSLSFLMLRSHHLRMMYYCCFFLPLTFQTLRRTSGRAACREKYKPLCSVPSKCLPVLTCWYSSGMIGYRTLSWRWPISTSRSPIDQAVDGRALHRPVWGTWAGRRC